MTVPGVAVASRPCEVRQGASFGPAGDAYEVGEELGSGAASRVFACRRCRTGEQFAVKVVNIQRMKLMGDLPTHMSRLDREVQILRQLRHERIVNLEDFHRTEDSYFLVMERVRGGELFNQIVLKSLTELEARHVFRQLLEGVGYMHSQSIIHRDLKPENILIVRSQPAGQDVAEILHDVKIADFGLSKAINEGTSLAKTCVGTPQYWAPEVLNIQRSGGTYDHAADLWGLGAVLFVMLCGRYPFDGRKMPLDEQIRTAAFSMCTPKWRGISDEAKSLVSGLLKVSPTERLQLEECLRHPWVVGTAICRRLRDPAGGKDKQKTPGRRRRAPITPCQASTTPAVPSRGLAPVAELVQPLEAAEERPASRGSADGDVQAGEATSTRSPSCESATPPLSPELSPVNERGPCRRWRRWLVAFLVGMVAMACHLLLMRQGPPPRITEAPRNLEPLGTQVALVPPSIVPATTTTARPSTEALPAIRPGQAQAAGPGSGPGPQVLGQAHEQKPVWASEALGPQFQAVQVPLIQLPGPGPRAEEACTEQETIFRLSELLKLQVSIAGSLEMACLAFRHADLDLADATRQTFRQARDLFQHAADVVSRYGLVAQQVRTTVLPDLRLAVEEQEGRLAIDLLGMVKTWVSRMKGDADDMRGRYAELQASVLRLAGRAQRSKLSADQRLAEAVQAAELQAPADGSGGDASARELLALDVCGSRHGQPGAPPSDAAAGLDAASAGALSAPRSLSGITRGLFEQLGRLSVSHAVGDALALGARGTSNTRDEETWKQNVIDLLFMAPGITRLTLPPLETLNFTLDATSSEGKKAVLSASGAEMGDKSVTGSSSPLLGYSQEARVTTDTASRSAAALLRALRELRRVDAILRGCSTFWANMDDTVEKLAQMKEVTERLVGFATSSGRLRERFDQRLGEYADFWASLERLCRKYAMDHHTASTQMQEFVREVADAADLIDTAESARMGALAARWERQRRQVDDAADG